MAMSLKIKINIKFLYDFPFRPLFYKRFLLFFLFLLLQGISASDIKLGISIKIKSQDVILCQIQSPSQSDWYGEELIMYESLVVFALCNWLTRKHKRESSLLIKFT